MYDEGGFSETTCVAINWHFINASLLFLCYKESGRRGLRGPFTYPHTGRGRGSLMTLCVYTWLCAFNFPRHSMQ